MACAGTGFSFGSALSMFGGMVGGLGGLSNFAPQLGSIVSSVPGAGNFLGSVGAVAGVTGPFSSIVTQLAGGANPLLQLTSQVDSFSSLGNAFNLGSGSVTGMLGAGFESIGDGGFGFADAFVNHSGELFGSSPLQMVQTLAGAEGFAAISSDIAGPISNALTSQFGGAISSLTQALPIDGNFGNFLGSAIPDMTSMVTNGLTNFMPNIAIPGFAGDMINLGNVFDMGDMRNFGNPGQIISKLLNQGAGGITGLDSAFGDIEFEVDSFSNLGSSQFNDVLTGAMKLITNPQMIANAQQMLGSNIPNMDSLADFMDLSKVLPVSFDDIIPDSMEAFKEELQSIDLGSITTAIQFGELVGNLQAVDLNLIKNFTDVIDPEAASVIAAKFLGGTGPNNSVSVSDIMGSVGGIVMKDNANLYSAAMKEMDRLGAFTEFNAINAQLQAGIAGSFTSGSKVYDTDVITDPAGITHETLDSFVAAKRAQLEAAVETIASGASGTSAEAWSGAFGTAKSAYTAMQNKILSEDIHAAKTDLHLEFRNNSTDNAYTFVSGLTDKVANPAMLALLQGMNDAEDDSNRFKEYAKSAIAEAQNMNLFDQFGILPRASKIQEI